MPRKPNKKPSFFRVLIDKGFTQILRLPSAFLRKNAPENVKIRVHSGGKWNVKIEKIENDGGVFCFTKGWPEFAEDASLQIGEFLVFTLISTSEFAVNIYDTSFCEREIPSTHDSPVMLNSQARTCSSSFSSEKRSPLYFEITSLKRHQQSRISLPSGFSKAARMRERKEVKVEYVGNNYCETILVDPREWRVDLAQGWSKFREANELAFGKSYSFEFKPNKNAIHVKEVKKSN